MPISDRTAEITEQTPDELRIAERYLWVLDYLSRTAQAVRRGDWDEVDDVAQDLARRAGQLAEAARERHDPTSEPRADVVVGIVGERNSDSEAAALLHPYRPGAVSKTSAKTSVTNFLLDPFRVGRPVPVVDCDPDSDRRRHRRGRLPSGGDRA